MITTLLSMRRLCVLLATIALLVVFAVTPVAAGECDDDDEDCDTGSGGIPNTALQVAGPDYSALLTVVGGASLISAAGLRLATRKRAL